MMQMNKAPFYRTQWGIPQQPPRYNKAPSKVVTIPVHFVGSDRTRTESAIKIQKVARGFMVRKSVKKMVAIRVELEQIENNVHVPETVELIRRENRERVRVSESIMNLLLRLDSVRVLHYSALRDCRKSLIKRAIALQEFVDQMVDVGPTDKDQHQTTQGTGDTESDFVVGSSEMVVADSEGMSMTEKGLENEKERVETSLVEEENCLVKEEEGDQEEGKKMEALRNEEKMEVEEKKEEEDGEGGCVGEESMGTSLVEEGIQENCQVKEEEGEVGFEEEEEGNCKGGDGGKMELLERMMEDNQKMMEMMAQLFERNEMQTRLLSSLSQRVDQLERAFACDKLRRKKRRNADAKHKETDPKKSCS